MTPQETDPDLPMSVQEFLVELAEKGDCVIVGRGADKILERYQPLSIFVYADMESKISASLPGCFSIYSCAA